IMLLDEPFSHLDIQHQSKLLSLIKTIAEEKKKTIVISLHDLNL
ncbi:MAG TPA: ABC transporter, partial [Treponema sp.]|nr:ABC transporter [Treponema sp.]